MRSRGFASQLCHVKGESLPFADGALETLHADIKVAAFIPRAGAALHEAQVVVLVCIGDGIASMYMCQATSYLSNQR